MNNESYLHGHCEGHTDGDTGDKNSDIVPCKVGFSLS